jgi:hypothetical protein
MQTNANAQRDLETLTALNRDFVASVQKGDVKRLDEIFADDFMARLPTALCSTRPSISSWQRSR